LQDFLIFIPVGLVVEQHHQRASIPHYGGNDYTSRARFRSDMKTSIAFVLLNEHGSW